MATCVELHGSKGLYVLRLGGGGGVLGMGSVYHKFEWYMKRLVVKNMN